MSLSKNPRITQRDFRALWVNPILRHGLNGIEVIVQVFDFRAKNKK